MIDMRQQTNSFENLITRRVRTGRLRRFVAMLSAFVLLTTMNTLKLNADTLERIATCGIAQHVHDESCYDADGELACGLEEHVHTDACYQQRPTAEDKASTRIDGYVPLDAQVRLASPVEFISEDEDTAVEISDVDDAVDEVMAELQNGDADDRGDEDDIDLLFTPDDEEALPVSGEDATEIDDTIFEVEGEEEIAAEDESEAEAEMIDGTIEDEVAEDAIIEDAIIGDESVGNESIEIGTTDEENTKYTYELGDSREVLLSTVLEALGIQLDQIDSASVARSDEVVLSVALNEDGDYVITALEGFEKGEIVVVGMEGETVAAYIIAITAAKAEEETEVGEADKAEEAPEIKTEEEVTEEKKDAEETAAEETEKTEENAEEQTEVEEIKDEDGAEEVQESDEESEAAEVAIVENDNVTIVPVGDNSLSGNLEIVYNENVNKQSVVDRLDAILSGAYQPGMMSTSSAAMSGLALAGASAGNETAGQYSDYAVFDISLLDDGVQRSETGEVGVVVRPENVNIYDNLPGNATATNVEYTLYHIHNSAADTLPVSVDCGEDGSLLAVDFTTDSFSYFVLKYTVEYTTDNNEVTVKLDFTDIVKNGVDFDTNSVITALNDGVAVRIDELEQGYIKGTDSVVNGELYIDYTTADNKNENIKNVNWIGFKVVSVDEGLTVADGKIKVTKDGTVVLSDGISTINIVISGYQNTVQKVLGDGATIEALNGELPMGASAEYKDLSDKADELAETYNLKEETENAEVGFSAFDVAVTTPDGELPVDGSFAVTVEHNVQIPEGAKVELFHIHNGEAELVENAQIEEGKVTFVTDGFSEYVVRYTVDFHYGEEEVSIEGETQVLLSTLIKQLGIKNENGEFIDVANVASVSFSDERLVTVEEVSGEVEVNGETVDVGEKDFLLTSKEPFTSREQLILNMNSEEQIEIDVTDAMETTSPWDLANTDNTQWLHVSAESTVTETEQARNASFDLMVTYSLKEEVVKAMDNYNDEFIVVYDLNKTLENAPVTIQDFTNGQIKFGNRKIGEYSIVNGVVTLKFTDYSYFNDKTVYNGYFNVTVVTEETKLGINDEYTYTFPGTTDTIPIKYKKSVEEGSKSVNAEKDADGNWVLHYTANINLNTDLTSLKFTDTIGGLQTLDTSSVKIGGRPVTVTTTGSGFTFDVQTALGTTGVAKGSYQVTYDTKLTDAQLKAMTAEKTTETNKVTWKVNGNKDVPGGETSKEFEKPKEPIPVTKTISATDSAPGDTVTYSITFGKETTEPSGFHISDNMTDVVIPQGKVTLTYNGQSTEIDFGSQSTDTSYSKNWVNLFDYTFPEGTAGNGPVTATYSVKLIDADTAKANGIYDATDVTNTAQEHRQNTSDTKKTTVTYNKEPHYEVNKTATRYTLNADGKIEPGTEITYTLTIGDTETNMAGVPIKDIMSDLQVLQGDIMIKVGNGSQQTLSTYAPGALKWSDDNQYSVNDVTLFEFNMPSDAGNGPVVITYTTKVIDAGKASAANLYGNLDVKNTGHGGKEHDGTSIPGVFPNYPIAKTVTVDKVDVNGTTRQMKDTVHYRLTLGHETMNLADAVIEDYITDLQKLVGDITITKADGTTSFVMPTSTGPDADNGNRWIWIDDGKYSKSDVCLFKYKLPADIGYGPITIEYDCQIISEDDAKENGINDTTPVKNTFNHNGHTATTTVNIEFPKTVTHNPQVRKEFDHWDFANSMVYWNIIVEKDVDSAYPLENVWVQEDINSGKISINEGNQGYWGWNQMKAADFDVVNAVVTTDDGTVLTPGVDYTIDQNYARFTFPKINERVHINLAFKSPAKIIDGYKMTNRAILNNGNFDDAEQTWNNPKIQAVKNGTYKESDRIITWEVQINPTAKTFEMLDSNKYTVLFEDYIPAGLKLLNYTSEEEDNPTLNVAFGWRNYNANVTPALQEDGTYKISTNIHPKSDTVDYSDESNKDVSLSGNKVVVKYKTKLSDEEWNNITSSASGSEVFENKVTITAGDDEKFDASDKVTVTSEGFITKTDSTAERDGFVVDADNPSSHSKNITYTVEINPNGYVMNHGETLELTDYIDTNMDLDTESVKLVSATKNASTGKLVANDPETTPAGIEISYNDDARLMSIRCIPDRTPLLLTYTCFARAQGQDTFKNTATLIGGGSHSDFDSKTHKVQTNDAGVILDGISFNLKKVDENNISKPLKNANFQLYECKLEIGDLTNSDTYNQAYWDALLAKMNRITAGNGTQEEIDEIKSQFKITEYVPVGDAKTTGETGYVDWASLNEHRLYAWKETRSPENYTGNDEYHYFVGYQHIDMSSTAYPQPLLPEAEQVKRKNAAWALDDACQLANDIRVASIANLVTWTATNVESKYTSISATKKWENDSDNLFKTRPIGGIKLQLVKILANGTRENVGNSVVINADKNGNWPTYIWNKLPAYDEEGNEYKYTVVETKVPNYTTQYSDEGEGLTSGAITVTNRMIPKSTDIHVEKRFDPDDTEKPNEIKVKLYVIETDEDGVSSEPKYTYQQATLNAINEWKYTFEKLDTTRVDKDSGKVYTLTYTVLEDTSALEANGFHYTVTYSDNGKGILENKADDPLVITNKKIKYGDLEVTKELLGDVTGNENKVFYVTVKNSKNEYLQSDRTTFGSTPYEFSVTPSAPLSVTHLVVDVYTVEEKTGTGYVDIIDGYEWDKSGSTTTGEATLIEDDTVTVELKNKYVPKMEISVTKTWNDVSVTRDDEIPKDASATLGLYTLADGTETPYPDEEHQLTVILNGTAGTDPASNGAYGYQEEAWKATWKNLPRYDVNGNQITYVVKEKSATPESLTFKTVYDGNEQATHAADGESIENQYTSFRVQKRWMSNGTTWKPNYSVGTIYYHLYKVNGESKELVGGLRELKASTTINIQVKVEDRVYIDETTKAILDKAIQDSVNGFSKSGEGNSAVYTIPYADEITPLPILDAGWSYEVVECSSAGAEFEQGDEKTHWVCNEFGDSVRALKNDLTDVTAKKTWDDKGNTVNHPAVTFKLYRTTETVSTWSNENGYTAPANWGAAVGTETIPANATGEALTVKWSDLPKYDIATGLLYTYKVEEETVPGYTLKARGLDGRNKYAFTFENELDTTELNVEKKWEINGEDATEDQLKTVPKITYQVWREAYSDSEKTNKIEEEDITAALKAREGNGITGQLPIVTPTGEEPNQETTYAWTEAVKDLPTTGQKETTTTNDNGTPDNDSDDTTTTTYETVYYKYYIVEEAGDLYPSQIATENELTHTHTLTNKLVDAEVTKLWQNVDGHSVDPENGTQIEVTLKKYAYHNNAPLGDAVVVDTITMTYVESGTEKNVVVKRGDTELQKLPADNANAWKYEWKDLAVDGTAETTVNENQVEVTVQYHYQIVETVASSGYNRATGESSKVKAPTAKIEQTITNVKNPSFELPSTGGPGTTGLYIVGSILTLLALVLLITKKRTEGQGID